MTKLNRTELWQLATTIPLAADGEAPESILVFRWGVNPTSKGNLLFDELAWKQIDDAYRQYGNSLGFDGEHETFNRDRKKGGVVTSYGWTKQLRTDAEGLWADVGWTDDVLLPNGGVDLGGRTLIKSRRVRYFSPVLDYERSSGRIVRLHTFALTIYPATHNQRPLAASAVGEDEPAERKPTMNPLALLLGLRADADETAVANAVNAMRSELTAICHALGAADGARALEVARTLATGRSAILAATGAKDEQEALGAVRAGQVARERLTTVEAENAALRTTNDGLARAQLFAAHPTRWTPALREKWGAESVAFLTKMTEDLPEQATAGDPATPPGTAAAGGTASLAASAASPGAGATATPAGPPVKLAPLSPDEKKLAADMGIPEAEFAAKLAAKKPKPGHALH